MLALGSAGQGIAHQSFCFLDVTGAQKLPNLGEIFQCVRVVAVHRGTIPHTFFI